MSLVARFAALLLGAENMERVWFGFRFPRNARSTAPLLSMFGWDHDTKLLPSITSFSM